MTMQKSLAVFTILLLTGCNAGPNRTNIELIQDMMDQTNIKAQEGTAKGEATVRVPPEGTVPQGYKPYRFKGDPIGAEAQLNNPLAQDFSPEVLELGQKRYEIYCKVCHGIEGKGDGPVAAKMLIKPKSLVSDTAKNFRDGRIFHIVTDGQGVMGSYANQIRSEKERWALVNYVRTLQKKSVN